MVVAEDQAVRYAITNLSTDQPATALDSREARRLRLQESLLRWILDGIDFVQLREKTLEAGELFLLAKEAMDLLRNAPDRTRPRLLINGRPDIAAAAGADGVHLTSRPGELTPAQARAVFRAAGLPCCTISVSCHTLPEVLAARDQSADLILFGPVFEKTEDGCKVVEGIGLEALAEACRLAEPTPVLALGGITEDTVPDCLARGAAGAAGIRLFGQNPARVKQPCRVRK